MSSSDRRTLLFGALALAGCGFTPAYGPGGASEGLRGRIEVAAPEDEEGFAFVRRLENRLGPAEAAAFRLEAELFLREDAVGFLPDGAISRYNVLGRADWRLIDLSDGSLALSGAERSFTSYSATSTTVATIVAQRDARRRLTIALADRITADLIAGMPA